MLTLAYNIKSFSFDRTQARHLMSLQADANNMMSDAWGSSSNVTIPYYRAAYMEAAECIGHIGFKWWKAFNPDMKQAQMELIDILHFGLSDWIRTSNMSFDRCWEKIMEPANADGALSVAKFDIIRTGQPHRVFSSDEVEPPADGNIQNASDLDTVFAIEKFMEQTLMYRCVPIAHLYFLFENFGMTSDQVYGMYVGKNVLNQFRTNNGQRTNDYYKIWDGREDNEYVTEILERDAHNNHVTDPEDLALELGRLYASAEHKQKA